MPGTVTVGCKLPNGLHLDVFKMVKVPQQIMGGGVREVDEARPDGRVTVRGIKRLPGDDPRISSGFALTHGVSADHWERWYEANKDSDLVRNGLIFAHAKVAETEAQAKDHRAQNSGMEPIDPKALPPEFKSKIETADVKG